jgi:phenol hydroxylase P3 protein
MLCQVCQIPAGFTEAADPTVLSLRHSEFRGERYNFCSDGCQWIFEREPEKYVQAWLPVHQIYQGNCGGATVPDVLRWYGIQDGVDNGEYLDSRDKRSWDQWHNVDQVAAAATATNGGGH